MIKPTGYVRELTMHPAGGWRGSRVTLDVDVTDFSAIGDLRSGPVYVLSEEEFRNQLQQVVNKARMGIPLDFKEDRSSAFLAGRQYGKSYMSSVYNDYIYGELPAWVLTPAAREATANILAVDENIS